MEFARIAPPDLPNENRKLDSFGILYTIKRLHGPNCAICIPTITYLSFRRQSEYRSGNGQQCRTQHIDLDKTEFIVQEKADLIFAHLKKLLDQGDKEKAQKCIQEVLAVVKRRMDKGISDHDKAVKHNYGFIGDRAVHFDIGRIEKVSKPKEYNRINERINTWLQANDSSL